MPAIIFRLPVDGEGLIVPGVVEYLARDEGVLLTETEWSWGRDIDQAYHFEDTTLADRHLEGLIREGLQHGHVKAFGEDLRRAREERHRRPVPAPEVYAETARRLGERD